MGARGLEKLFQSSLKMTMQSDPWQPVANNQHGMTASKPWAWDSKRKYQSFSTQLEPILQVAEEGIFCWGLHGGRKEGGSKTFCVCPGWVCGPTQQWVSSRLRWCWEGELLALHCSCVGSRLLHPQQGMRSGLHACGLTSMQKV